jgi:uncharacterized membrane protein YqjE
MWGRRICGCHFPARGKLRDALLKAGWIEAMTASTTELISSREAASETTRWGQLIIGIICMVMIANLQYGWTLFVNPIDQKYHWGRAAIQVAFTIFVVTETWLVPFEGYLIDRYGPKVMVCGSGLLVAVAWMINAYADSLALLYLAAAIGGIGAGIMYRYFTRLRRTQEEREQDATLLLPQCSRQRRSG